LLTAATISFGVEVLRRVIRVDLRTALARVHTGGEFDTAVRLLDNAWRATAGLVSWAALWIIVWIPWQVLSNVLRASNPQVSRAVADIGGGLAAFVVTGMCIYVLRIGLALALTARETGRAFGRVEQAADGRRNLSTPHRGIPMRLILVLTTPTDFDFILAGLVGVVSFFALVNYAHTQGHPL
jgi:hypothetical protein